MDWVKLIESALMLVIALVIPIVAAKIGTYIAAKGDVVKQEKRLLVAQEIDKMAESALNMMRINNPNSLTIANVDKTKDDLMAKILADATIPVTKGAIAGRVAGNAVFNAALDEFLAKPKAGA